MINNKIANKWLDTKLYQLIDRWKNVNIEIRHFDVGNKLIFNLGLKDIAHIASVSCITSHLQIYLSIYFLHLLFYVLVNLMF